MNSRNVVRLFMTTLLIGGVTGGIAGIIVRWNEFWHYFISFEVFSILSAFIWLFGVGLIFSVISQAGFFAYLTIHRFGLGLFKSLWNAVQVVLIVFALFDVVYLRYTSFESGEGIAPYLWPALFMLAAGLFIAFLKVKQSNRQTFIPALFFIVVVTIIEWTPVLKGNDESWLYFMLVPLVVCNAYQLLSLQPFIQRSQQELVEKKRSSNPSGQAKNKHIAKGE
jgi:KinB signaling pathway activation protein